MRFRVVISVVLFAVLSLLPIASAQAENLEGTIIASAIDYRDGSSEKIYDLKKDNGETVRLKMDNPEEFSYLARKTGARINVSGERNSDGSFQVSTVSLFQAAPLNASSDFIGGTVVSGTRRAAIIVATYGSQTVRCTNDEIVAQMYTDTPSVRSTYEASSRGQLTFNSDADGNGSVDIFGPVTISESSGTCTNYTGWGQAAFEAAQALGFNDSNYQHLIFVLPAVCGYGGVANISCGDQCTAYILDCDSIEAWIHELGHNFGMEHASRDNNNDGQYESEYGDQSCPMGFSIQGRAKLFNAPHHDQLGWLDAFPGKIVTATQTATYNISALENDSLSDSNPQIIRIQQSSDEFYYLSYRASTGVYGANLTSEWADKLNVHRMPISRDKTRYVGSADVGENFEDASLGVKFCVNSKNSTTMNVTLIFGSADCPTGRSDGGGSESGPISGDSDGDTVTDTQETADGTDPADPGSYLERLNSPVYTLWNSFLSLTNILELINPDTPGSSSTTTVAVSLYAIDGSLVYTQDLVLAAGQQFDLILNSLPGFLSESYGIVKISYTGNLAGRMSYYRNASDGESYEFAFSIPLSSPLRGTTGAGFNTYQPSTNAAELEYSVYNWLTIVNLANEEKSFTINSYNQVGTLLTTRNQTVSSLGRVDLDAGHGLVGPNIVGYHEIIPSDANADYIAQVIRYGSNATATTSPTAYFFGFPLSARPGNGQPVYLPISRQFSETNWVEVINTLSTSTNIDITFYNSAGTARTVARTFAPYEQIHFFVSDEYLTDGESGYVKVTPSAANSVVAQSMFYYRDGFGGMNALAGVSSREALGSRYNGSFNLYLGMENWTKISNVTDSTVTATLRATATSGGGSRALVLGPRETVTVGIHSDSDLNASPDTYGFVQVEPDVSKSLSVDIFRLRYLNSSLDFAFPTEVRAE